MKRLVLVLALAACRGDTDGAPRRQASPGESTAPGPLAEAVALRDRARKLVHLGNAHDARPLLERAIARISDAEGPSSRALLEPLFELGVLELSAGRLEAAIAANERLLAIEPDDPRALFDLAELLRAVQRPAEALPYYDRAAKSPEAIAGAALARLDTGDHAGALASLREPDPRAIQLLTLAYAQLVTGAPADAAATVAKAEALLVDDPLQASTRVNAELVILKAELDFAADKLKEAKAAIKPALDACAPATPCGAWIYAARRRIEVVTGDH